MVKAAPIWLIVLMIGFPQFSETVYSPVLPAIATSLQANVSLVEFTITIYLFGFALGMLFWGNISDKRGRKPCVLAGFVIFTLGSIGCYFSYSIGMLIFSRFLQAIGGSGGTVLGQTITRESFYGTSLTRAFAITSSVLAVSPAIGPFFGGLIAEKFGWPSIFLLLIVISIVIELLIILRLPETHPKENRKHLAIKPILLRMLKDRQVIGSVLIVGSASGIIISYFAEGPFYLITALGLTSSTFGVSFLSIATGIIIGGLLVKRFGNTYPTALVMRTGIIIIICSAILFGLFAIVYSYFLVLPKFTMITVTLICQTIIALGVCVVVVPALALALVNYDSCIGTASSLFGFLYYSCSSMITLGMGYLHNGTLLPMPIYFAAIGFMMLLVQKFLCKEELCAP